VLVFVALSQADAERALRALKGFAARQTETVGETLVLVGYLDDEGDFASQGEIFDRPMKRPGSTDGVSATLA
jgi:hypothetical protein